MNAQVDARLDPGPAPAVGTLGTLLRWVRTLDTAGIDAMLQVTTFRLVAASSCLILLGAGSINQRRAIVGTALVSGSALIFLRAVATDSVCLAIDRFAFVIILPMATQSSLVVYRLHYEEEITKGAWAYFAALMIMMTAWSVASAVCSSSWLMLSFAGFVLSSVLLLLTQVNDNAGVFFVLGAACYISSFSTMYLIWAEALPMLA